jgi:FkbM family methyltransferase
MTMLSKIKNKLSSIIKERFPSKSYSQCGEDLIIDFLFQGFSISKPTYLDIGAFHPKQLSNTYRFYRRGSSGICIEPNPARIKLFQRTRPRDKCVNIGIGDTENKNARFYVMSSEALSTFSESEALELETKEKIKIKKILTIPIITFSTFFRDYCTSVPDFISIDIEGNELETLQNIDFTQYRPKVICIETICFARKLNQGIKREETIRWLQNHGYKLYADTFINSIFVNQEFWGT